MVNIDRRFFEKKNDRFDIQTLNVISIQKLVRGLFVVMTQLPSIPYSVFEFLFLIDTSYSHAFNLNRRALLIQVFSLPWIRTEIRRKPLDAVDIHSDNIKKTTRMSSITSLPTVEEYFTRYGMTGYLILGNIGLILNIAVFSQRISARNPCLLYLLSMSICGLIGLNISTIPYIYALDHSNPLKNNLFLCRFQFYLRHAFNQLMRTFFVIACADRYACSSKQAKIRAFSRDIVAVRAIPAVVLFWLLIAIFPTMLRTLHDGKCDARSGAYDIIYTIYILITLGIFPLVTLSIFGVLMMRNLKQLRGENLRKRDQDMMRMLLIELIIYIITTIPNTVMHIYKSAAANVEKSKERELIETFVIYIARVFLLYMSNTFSFWIYLSTSQSFRLEVRTMLIRYAKFFSRK